LEFAKIACMKNIGDQGANVHEHINAMVKWILWHYQEPFKMVETERWVFGRGDKLRLVRGYEGYVFGNYL
jgi:hypothetical protein